MRVNQLQQPNHRVEDKLEQAQDRRRPDRNPLVVGNGDAIWGRFLRKSRITRVMTPTAMPMPFDWNISIANGRGDGSRGDVDQVVSDQDGDDQTLVVVFQVFDQQDPLAVLLDQVLDPDIGKGDERGFNPGEKCRQTNKSDKNKPLLGWSHSVLLDRGVRFETGPADRSDGRLPMPRSGSHDPVVLVHVLLFGRVEPKKT